MSCVDFILEGFVVSSTEREESRAIYRDVTEFVMLGHNRLGVVRVA